jgi:hypothetical protein
MTKKQSQWTVTLTDGEEIKVYAAADATEEDAKERAASILKHHQESRVLDSMPSSIPEIVDGELASAAKRDYAALIAKVERA